ncbi:Phosphoenolpyruvate/pyruvate domain-containing protein [Hortaea werneckii]|nr:Phosphoenolpyruvate/pyruvate domain-containing protein [Hortaea werneckii]KAI7008742.1 Phosphoenolpyruvate/pyruvate domain-containing protein [Hortaea werneckii]
MRPTAVLLQHALRLTFFTRPNCMLCTEAKDVLSKVWDRRHFEYEEVDIMQPADKEWRNLYEFDTPVVHFDKTRELEQTTGTTAKARKLMHRFTEAEVETAMDDVEQRHNIIMQAANRLQRILKTGKTAFGGWQMLPGANLSRTIARTPNLDWICVDTEHGNISDDSMHECVAAIAACGVSPVVRVPEGQHWMIKRALDAGAHGLMVPLVRSVEDAKNTVKYSKFPPRGTRGLGSPFSMEKFSPEITQMQYLQEANDATVVILQIETAKALENVRRIAAVPGVDVLLVGPFDLGNSIGHPIMQADMDPELHEAIAEIHSAAQESGKWSAIYCRDGDQARHYAEQGFNMCSAMTDAVALKKAFGEAFKSAKGG